MTLPRIPGLSGANNTQQQRITGTTTVRRGETTTQDVAERVGVTDSELRRANPELRNPSQLRAGQELNVPEHQEPPSSPRLDGADVVAGDWRVRARPAMSTTNRYDGTVEGNQARDRYDQGQREREQWRHLSTPDQVAESERPAREEATRRVDEGIERARERAGVDQPPLSDDDISRMAARRMAQQFPIPRAPRAPSSRRTTD